MGQIPPSPQNSPIQATNWPIGWEADILVPRDAFFGIDL